MAPPAHESISRISQIPSEQSSIRAKFGYDKLRWADAQNAERSAKLEEAHRSVEEERRNRAYFAQKERRGAVERGRFLIWGKVLQKTSAGLLITPTPTRSGPWTVSPPAGWNGPAYRALCLLTDFPDQRVAADEQAITVYAYPDGEYRYTAVSGGNKTVRRFTCDINKAQPISDAEISALIRTGD